MPAGQALSALNRLMTTQHKMEEGGWGGLWFGSAAHRESVSALL